MLEHDQLKAQLESYVQRESELQKLKEDLDKREAELIREKQDMDGKLNLFVTGDEAYGLTRNRISCKHWHELRDIYLVFRTGRRPYAFYTLFSGFCHQPSMRQRRIR